MKYVIDVSVAEKWYLPRPDFTKALRFRSAFHAGLHELLAPDNILIDLADLLTTAERRSLIDPCEATRSFADFVTVGIQLCPSSTLFQRAIDIALAVNLTASASMYVALAEHERCQLLTADTKFIRRAGKHFSFVVPFDSLP